MQNVFTHHVIPWNALPPVGPSLYERIFLHSFPAANSIHQGIIRNVGRFQYRAGVGDYRRIKTTQRQIFLTSGTSGTDTDFYPKDGLCYFTNGSKIWNSVTMEAAV